MQMYICCSGFICGDNITVRLLHLAMLGIHNRCRRKEVLCIPEVSERASSAQPFRNKAGNKRRFSDVIDGPSCDRQLKNQLKSMPNSGKALARGKRR